MLETIERQKTELSRFLSPQVAALVSTPEGEALLAGHRREATALFSDCAASPRSVIPPLRRKCWACCASITRMGALIVEYGGTLEHFAATA
jgi:hypothetical protein